MVQVLSQSTPKARKAHRCEMCFRVIEPGETYHRQFNVTDYGGDVYTWKECSHCSMLVRLCDFEDWDGMGIGPDNVNEMEPRYMWELRLKALWGKKWRRKDGTLYPIPTDPADLEQTRERADIKETS